MGKVFGFIQLLLDTARFPVIDGMEGFGSNL